MWPDWISNSGPLTYESGALLTALCGPARAWQLKLLKNLNGSTLLSHVSLSLVVSGFYGTLDNL